MLVEKYGTGIFLMKEKNKARKESVRKNNHTLSKRLSHQISTSSQRKDSMEPPAKRKHGDE